MAAGAFIGPFLGVTLALVSLDTIDAGVSASITALAPLVAMLLAARFHGEQLSWRAWAGAVIAVAGVVVLFRR
jgi:drug/metabolite transporter (DMT)-like permease